MCTHRRTLLGWSCVVVLAAPLCGEDLEEVFARYAAVMCAAGVSDPGPEHAQELMYQLDLLADGLVLDLSTDSQPRALWWDAGRQAVGARADDWAAVLATGVDSCGRVAFASDSEPGVEPRVTGWLDAFEDRLLVQVSFSGQVTRAVITPDAGGSGEPVMVKKCICVGRADRCIDIECDNGSACGSDSKGRCRWVDETPPSPAPPPKSGCCAINGAAALMLFACPHRAIARRWLVLGRAARRTR